MQAIVELPQAFSVREENEFHPMAHLMARLNPRLMVVPVATGVHVHGGCTVFWGLVYLEGQSPTKKEVEAALRAAGFDFTHNVLTQASNVCTNHAADAAGERSKPNIKPSPTA